MPLTDVAIRKAAPKAKLYRVPLRLGDFLPDIP
jgi:hypothetical protein